MQTNPFSNVLSSILFHATLLSTMFAMPLVLAARYDSGAAIVNRDAPVWNRLPDVPAKVEPQRDFRLPHTDAPVPRPAAKHTPIDRSGPDAGMIRPGKVRAKTIRV